MPNKLLGIPPHNNILLSKLCRAGSVAYFLRSGGMSNEFSRNSNGVYEGIDIDGDRYPGLK